MLNQISKLSLLVVFAIAMMFTACEKENLELTSNYTIGEEIATDSRGGDKGKRGGNKGNKGQRGTKCFELVYPVSIAFADGTTVEVADKAAAKEAKKAWKEANPDATERPSLVFPVSIDQDGAVTSIADQEALKAATKACRGERGGRGGKGGKGGKKGGRGGKGAGCFQPVFPITLMVDGVATTIEDRAGKRAAIAAWKEANPDATEKPTVELGFPVTVELEDETTATINSQEELDALKASCKAEGDEG